MGVGDKGFDLGFVLGDEGGDVGLVEEFGALGLGEDEVGEEDEADPAVEGEPGGDGGVSSEWRG